MRKSSQRRSVDDQNRRGVPPPPGLLMSQMSQSQQGKVPQGSDKIQEILQDILRTLQDSSGEKDIESRFWATYSHVNKEHDDEFLERNNSDMDVVLIFSGLFSAINTAFIIAMQPNSTTVLLSQFLQNTSPNTVSTTYPNAATWFQGFAYIALSLSLLAAFGAVLGKQWLSHYKSNHIRGSIEDREKHRQQKLDGLETWHFRAMMQSFPVLLQISLFLFGIAISAFVWFQQGALAITVIVPTVFGALFYAFVIAASLMSKQCPFQTPISALIRFVWRYIKDGANGVILNETSQKPVGLDTLELELWSRWHDVALPWGLQDCKRSFVQYLTTLGQGGYENQARDTLRLVIATCCPGFFKSTDVALIWDGVFDWSDDQRTPEDFDWLVDFLVHFRTSSARNFGAMADALLALSAMQGLGSPTRQDNYLDSIIFSMQADKPSQLRHAALRAIFDARAELVSIADQEEGEFREELLTSLAPALLTATRPIAPQLSQDDPDALYNPDREYFYLRLIFTLAKQSDWSTQLENAGHIDRCAGLLEYVIRSDDSTTSSEPINDHPYYLAGALIRMNTSENYRDCGFTDIISESDWWKLLKGAWSVMWWNNLHDDKEALEVLPDIVKYTLEALKTEPAKYDSKSLVRLVGRIYEGLEDREADSDILSTVRNLKDALSDTGL